MNKYKITYHNKKDISVVRVADNAGQSIEKLCRQYGWRWTIKMVDADTRGDEWAQAAADTYGGINWDLTIFSEKL